MPPATRIPHRCRAACRAVRVPRPPKERVFWMVQGQFASRIAPAPGTTTAGATRVPPHARQTCAHRRGGIHAARDSHPARMPGPAFMPPAVRRSARHAARRSPFGPSCRPPFAVRPVMPPAVRRSARHAARRSPFGPSCRPPFGPSCRPPFGTSSAPRPRGPYGCESSGVGSKAWTRRVKVLPPPSRGASVTEPPWAAARLRAIESPRPAPPTSGGEVAGRLKG